MPKAGAYFLYMMDYKREQERSLGRTLNNGEVSQMASASWNAMSDDEKGYYKQKAKGADIRLSRRPAINNGDGGTQLTSQGVSVALMEREERDRKNQEETMRRRIGQMIQTIPLMTDFLNHPIYFMYGNYFYVNNDGKYAPAELAMLKFTFRDGILKKLHTFINPGKPELAFAFSVKEHSELTHQLPTYPKAYGEDNMGRVMYEIKKFMKSDEKGFDGGNQMVFAYADPYASEYSQLDVLNSFMDQIFGDSKMDFDICPLTRLFYALQKELAARGRCDDIPNEAFCNIFLSRDPYETIAGISCQYHESVDATRHCALSRVCRWSFLMADHFCERLGVQLIPGTHLPKNADVINSEIIYGSECDSKSVTSEAKDNFDGNIRLRGLGKMSSSEVKSEGGTSDTRQQSTSASVSELNDDVQSIRTASTATNGSGRGKFRPSRASIIAGSLPPQNSSTFYNP